MLLIFKDIWNVFIWETIYTHTLGENFTARIIEGISSCDEDVLHVVRKINVMLLALREDEIFIYQETYFN